MTVLAALAWLPMLVQAIEQPVDARIQMLAYDPGQVVTLHSASDFAAVIELSPEERADTVVLGETTGWHVTVGRGGTALVVTRTATAASTNMVVLTDARRYVFLLEPDGDVASGTFVLRFSYAPGGGAPSLAASRTAGFRLKGARSLFPVDMQDDGHRTIVTWGPGVTLPAVFAVDERGGEALVNGRMVGGDYVIEGTAARYIFRWGKAKATAVRRPIGADR